MTAESSVFPPRENDEVGGAVSPEAQEEDFQRLVDDLARVLEQHPRMRSEVEVLVSVRKSQRFSAAKFLAGKSRCDPECHSFQDCQWNVSAQAWSCVP